MPEMSTWKESLTETYDDVVGQVVDHAPEILGATVLLIVGWGVSTLLRLLSSRIVGGFDSLFQRATRSDGARREEIKGSYAAIVGTLVFWTSMLFFIAATANLLGWQLFTRWMEGVIAYLPNLITGVLIILAGILLGGGARAGVVGAIQSARAQPSKVQQAKAQQAEGLGRVVQAVIVFAAVVIGVEQIGIDVHFLSDIIVVVLGVLLAGAALAFGLGARTLVANVIGAQYARRHCRVGEQMTIGDARGTVAEVTPTAIVLETESGRTVVPAKDFQEVVSSFSADPDTAPPRAPDAAAPPRDGGPR